jgi:hypothetical protein
LYLNWAANAQTTNSDTRKKVDVCNQMFAPLQSNLDSRKKVDADTRMKQDVSASVVVCSFADTKKKVDVCTTDCCLRVCSSIEKQE